VRTVQRRLGAWPGGKVTAALHSSNGHRMTADGRDSWGGIQKNAEEHRQQGHSLSLSPGTSGPVSGDPGGPQRPLSQDSRASPVVRLLSVCTW